MLTMYQQITIKTLKNQGKTNRDISVELNCHRNTVANILSRLRPIESQTRDKPSYFDKYFDSIKKYLDQKVSRLRIWEILKAEYTIDRTYDALCKYIQLNFPKHKTAYVVQESDPGETAEVDFGHLRLVRDTVTGLMKKTYVAYLFTVLPMISRLNHLLMPILKPSHILVEYPVG
jgi:transposase